MKTLNLGILAHVDAGKTSLTERLLHAAGIIDEIGSVDAGNTQTDTLALERARGITIRSAVVSFQLGDVAVNLIDTPGHPDFIAEVERVLSVLDGAILVISAVEGVQAQTRILMRTLHRLHIPTLIFVNKIDRGGADEKRTLASITDKLTPAIIPMGSTTGLGTRHPAVTRYGPTDGTFAARLTEVLAEHDDALLARYVAGSQIRYPALRQELAAQTRRAAVHPVFFGSAITGAGITDLRAAITELLPATARDTGGPVVGTVFKVERGPAGEKIAYLRMITGTVHTRDRLRFGRDHDNKITAISVFDSGTTRPVNSLTAGQIGKITGLADIQIGDTIGNSQGAAEQHYFAPPTLDTVVIPHHPGDRGALRVALAQLAEQDPLINLRQDDTRHEIHVSLYGEIQKEIIQTTLAAEYQLQVTFRETTTICIERPTCTGEAAEFMSADTNPFLATVGLRIEPGPLDSGITFQLASNALGTMPLAFFKAVQDTVKDALQQGIHGWAVTDCTVTMTHTGYAPRQSHAHQGFSKAVSSTGADFRSLTPLVVMSALRQAGSTVYEPMHRFDLEIPADTLGTMLPALARLRAVPQTPALHGASYRLEGDIPADQVHQLQQQLSGLTHGEGVLESSFDHYQPVAGTVPEQPRTDQNPLNRKEYLLHVQRRV